MADSYPTLIHRRVAEARAGRNPAVIARVTSGWVVLGDDQRLAGYCLLLADPIADNLHALDPERRARFLFDMTAVGEAVIAVRRPSLINYSILGNTDRALHAHIHPRYDSEEPDQRRDHPIIYHWLKMPIVAFDPQRDQPLMAELRHALARHTELLD